MKRSVQDTPVVFIGAGNLATNLAKALYQNGFRIVQVYSRTKEAACALAQAIEAEYTTELSEVSRDARQTSVTVCFILCRLSANSARWISVRFLSS